MSYQVYKHKCWIVRVGRDSAASELWFVDWDRCSLEARGIFEEIKRAVQSVEPWPDVPVQGPAPGLAGPELSRSPVCLLS